MSESKIVSKVKHHLMIIGPPIFLLLVGAATFLTVQKLMETEITTISVVDDNNTSLNQLTTIVTEVVPPTATETAIMQSEVNAGNNLWRTDPLQAAKRLSSQYGFADEDVFTLTEATQNKRADRVNIEAVHGGKSYRIEMIQPEKTGEKGVWIIDKISDKEVDEVKPDSEDI